MRSLREFSSPTMESLSTDPTILRAFRGVPLRDLRNLYSNGTHALWSPEESPEPPPAWHVAARLGFVRTHALLALRKSHRGLGCLRARA